MARGNGKENELNNGEALSTGTGELKSGKDTGTETGTEGRGRRSSGRGTGDSNSGATKKEEVVSGLATVNPTETIPSPTEPKKAKKKRTVKKKTVKNDETFNSEQITALLLTVSTICSTSERGKIFALSELEARQLAEPLAKIIANNDSMKAIAEHSYSVALAMTCFMIFAPKIFMWIQYEKAHKKPKGIEVKTIKGEKRNAGKTETNNRGDNTGATTHSTNDSQNVLADLPSIM